METRQVISLDTEDTGGDFQHGSRCFFVTTCDEEGEQQYWEWPVDPKTRQPIVPDDDRLAIRSLIEGAETLVGQNIKFDVKALVATGIIEEWPWERTYDTLIAGHLLASNHRHDLTSMAIEYLGVDIEPYEKNLKTACDEARRWCRSHLKDWRIASKGADDMPSAKDSCWKLDTWLPRALVKHWWKDSKAEVDWLSGRKNLVGLEGWEYRPPNVEYGNHPWWTVLSNYSNTDSAVTLALWKRQERELHRRGLWKIFLERMKLPPIAQRMEERGLTLNGRRLEGLRTKFVQASLKAQQTCTKIAVNYGYDLELPKGAVNKSLRDFCFDVLRLEPVRNPKAKTDNPCLDSKNAIPYYLETLPAISYQRAFVEALVAKRTRDTAVSFIDSYTRFWLPLVDDDGEWYVLYPSLNITGSDTLRWSSSNPNSQQISKREGLNLRYIFGPTPGREWWSCDAKNIELRIPAYESGEQDLINLFERFNEPPYYGSEHLLNFSTVYHDIWEGELGTVCKVVDCCNGKVVDISRVGPHVKKKYAATWYQRCKNGDFAVGYGAVDRSDGLGTADRTFGRPGSHARLKVRFAKKEALNQKYIRYAEKHGYVETMPDRSVDPSRGYPILCSRTENGRIKPTVPLNYHVSGTAMWWTARAMVRCQDQLNQWRSRDGFDGHIVIQQHDEMVFDFPKSRVHPREDVDNARPGRLSLIRCSNLWRIRALQKLMEQGGVDIGVPTPTSCEYHEHTWSEGVSL